MDRQTRSLLSLLSVSIDDENPVRFLLTFHHDKDAEDLHYETDSPETCEEIVGRIKKAWNCALLEQKLAGH